MTSQDQLNKAIYKITIVFFLIIIIGIITLSLLKINLLNIIAPCPFVTKLGIYCPSCGATRSFLSLLHGNIKTSIQYHPAIFYVLTIMGIFFVSQTISRFSKNKIKAFDFKLYYIYIGFFLFLANFVIKNIPIFL